MAFLWLGISQTNAKIAYICGPHCAILYYNNVSGSIDFQKLVYTRIDFQFMVAKTIK